MGDLVATNLVKSFGRTGVLAGINLRVASGTLTTMLGASGSGKTTFLRLVCGFDRADAGTIDVAGRRVAAQGVHEPPERRRIGYVAQDGALFPHLTVADNILFGLPRRERTQAAAERLLALVGLRSTHAARRPHELSGGEQQRVALARALAPRPRIVLLDEPFSSLDAGLRNETRRTVAAALGEAGATALLVTHDQAEALSMGHEVAVLRDGHMLQVGPPQAVYRQPVDVALARFLGEAIVVSGVAAHGRVVCALGDLPLAAGMPTGPVEVMVRPEQIRLLVDGEASGRAATVADITFYGHDASVALVTDEAPQTPFAARLPGHVPLRCGQAVRFAVAGVVVTYAKGDTAAVVAHDRAASAPSHSKVSVTA